MIDESFSSDCKQIIDGLGHRMPRERVPQIAGTGEHAHVSRLRTPHDAAYVMGRGFPLRRDIGPR